MCFLYTIAVTFYVAAIGFFSIWNRKAALWINGRKNWENELRKKITPDDRWLWFHCSSLGEFEDGRTVIEAVRSTYPKYKILLTFFSPSGYEARKNYSSADVVTYLPADYLNNAVAFLDIVNPIAVFFIRNEIWFNFLYEIKRRKIPFFLISAVIGKSSSFFLFPVKYLYEKAFHFFDRIFCQDEMTGRLLWDKFGISEIHVSGNTRIDRVISIAAQPADDREVLNFCRNYFCVIAGSIMSHDIDLLTESIKKLCNKDIRWIIVPHEINESALLKIEKELKPYIIRYSMISGLRPEHSILCIDNIGMLAKIYRFADIAYVGGGFTKAGIHNILEPAVYGLPVAFGPNHRNYQEVHFLVESGGAYHVNNSDDISNYILKFYNDRQFLEEIKKKNSYYIHSCGGATARIMAMLDKENILREN